MSGRQSWLRDRLREGDRRVPGAAGAVADAVLSDHAMMADLVAHLDDDDPVVVSHAAHAAMQIAKKNPSLFDPHVEQLITLLQALRQWEIGEQLPKILANCQLTPQHAGKIADVLLINLESQSNIVAACSLQAIVDLASDERIDRARADQALKRALTSPRKALSARARKLQQQMLHRSGRSSG